MYVAPFARFQHFSLKDKDTNDKAKYTAFGGGVIAGWEKSFASGFVLDLYFGPAYNSGTFKSDSPEDDIDVAGSFEGFTIRTGISIGFSF